MPNNPPKLPALPTRTAALIDALSMAHRRGQQLKAADWSDAVESEEQAFAVQDGVARALGWTSNGQPIARHWKSGAATRPGPYGHAPLNPAHVGTDSEQIRPLSWPLLGFEAEVALRLARPVTSQEAQCMRPELAGDWVDAMCVSVELVASRWLAVPSAPELLRMADHQLHAGLLLGPWQPFQALDWPRLGLTVQEQDLAPVHGQGGHSLDDPTWLLPAWLQHLTRQGDTVPAGTVVTTGAWGGLRRLSAASSTPRTVDVCFERLGRVSLRL